MITIMMSQKRLVVWLGVVFSFLLSCFFLPAQFRKAKQIKNNSCYTEGTEGTVMPGANRLRFAALSGVALSATGCLPENGIDRLIHSDTIGTCLAYWYID